MVNLLIPKGQFLDSNSTLGIWVSGGVDSSLLCYLLAKKIKTENIPFKLQTVTIPKRPTDTHHLSVIDFIKKDLNCNDIFCDPIIYNTDHDNYTQSFQQVNEENVINGKYKYIYSGINQTPDYESYNDIWTAYEELENLRSSDANKLLAISGVILHEDKFVEFGEIRPFFNLNKKHIASLYKEHNLLDTLFPLTVSCNTIEYTNGHCGECWFCKERFWGFGKL